MTNRIIYKVKSWYWKTTRKLGIRLPKTVAKALKIERATDTDFQRMANIKIAWNIMMALRHDRHKTVTYLT
jgi:hypothetical protein